MVSCLHCLIIIFCVRFDTSNGYGSFTTLKQEYITIIEREIFNFIWNSKQDKVKRRTTIADYTEGGLKMIDLKENLALNKSAWQPTTYRTTGWTTFAAAAVDGNRDQYVPRGSCAMQKASTTAEWRVDLGKVQGIDYIDIYFRHDSAYYWDTQYKIRAAGFQIYVSNTTERVDRGLCFTEAGSVQPNMTIQCVQRGKYVIFYNTQNIKLYNELCEVEVYECPPERYGLRCNQTCSNCYANSSTICDHLTGKCYSGCKSGWKGDRCTEECDEFKYGPQCSMICGNCLNKTKCHHINGICPDGCQPGWQNHNCKSIERESPVQNHHTAMKSCETVLLGAIIGWIFNAIFIVCGLILFVLFKTRKLGLVKKRSTLYEDIQMKNPNDNHIYSATKSN